MPIYEYECIKCGTGQEVMQKIADLPLTMCPLCGGEMKKLMSNTSFVLKGEGWYVTDYASGDRKTGRDAEKGADGGLNKKPADQKNGKESAEKPAASTEAGTDKATKVEPKKESKKEASDAK